MDLTKISETLIAGKVDELKDQTNEAINSGSDPADVLNKGLLPGMDAVGQKWKDGDMFMPEVLRSAKAMSGAMDILRPKLSEGDLGNAGTLVIGTVAGDLHDIGKDLAGFSKDVSYPGFPQGADLNKPLKVNVTLTAEFKDGSSAEVFSNKYEFDLSK